MATGTAVYADGGKVPENASKQKEYTILVDKGGFNFVEGAKIDIVHHDDTTTYFTNFSGQVNVRGCKGDKVIVSSTDQDPYLDRLESAVIKLEGVDEYGIKSTITKYPTRFSEEHPEVLRSKDIPRPYADFITGVVDRSGPFQSLETKLDKHFKRVYVKE